MSRANQAAGTAPAASALRTTAGLRMTATGRKPFGRRRIQPATAGTPSTASIPPTMATIGPVEGDCTSSTTPAAVAATSAAPNEVEPRAAAVGRDRAPEEGEEQRAEHRQGDHRTPAEQPSMTPPASGPRQLTAAAMPATRPSAGALGGSGVPRADDGHAESGYGGRPGALDDPGCEEHPEVRRQRTGERTGDIRPTPMRSGSRIPTRSETRP